MKKFEKLVAVLSVAAVMTVIFGTMAFATDDASANGDLIDFITTTFPSWSFSDYINMLKDLFEGWFSAIRTALESFFGGIFG